MNKTEVNSRKQISDIVSVVKLSSLLFLGMGFFEHFSSRNKVTDYKNSLFPIYMIITGVLVLSFVYCIWAFSTVKKLNLKYMQRIQLIENFVIILIFYIVLLMSGANASEFKFLFLLIIITTTIQCGGNQGMLIACISSFCILTMDIVYSTGSAVNQYFQNDLIMAGIFILTAWPLGFYVKVANNYIEELKSLANEDGLTGVYNHRFFHDALSEKIISCEKENVPVSVIFIDIDYFKHYNDLYGHQKGDEVLRIIGLLLKNIVRKEDVVARYGGEEFAIILPGTSENDAISIAEAIRKKVEETYFEGEENQPNGKVTVSIGISVYPEKAKNDIELIKCADDALYRAKFFNKNRVETYTSILDELKKDIDEEHIDLVTSIKTLISVINAKDRYTYAHVERVVAYCKMLANKLKLTVEDKKTLIYGAYMHDIGKINIAEHILIKKMPLTAEEWEMLKQHPANGVEIIKSVKSLYNIIPLILYHHERYDGSGYPDNLKGVDIPYLARMLTVVDSFDAMTSNRPYNKRKTYEEAIIELKKCSGSQFDTAIANAFIEVINENRDSFNN
jgi:diguanylate cyclase (GGDEF)-like protein